jgi:hypothetical protein
VHLRRARRRVKVSTVSPFIYLCIPAITFPSLLFLRSPFRSSLAIIFSPPRLFAAAFDPLPHLTIPGPSPSLPHQPYPSIPSHRSHPSSSPPRRPHLTVPTSLSPPHCPHLAVPTSPSPSHHPHLTIPISPSPPSCHSLSSSLPYHSRLTIPTSPFLPHHPCPHHRYPHNLIFPTTPFPLYHPYHHPHINIHTSPFRPHRCHLTVPTSPFPPYYSCPYHPIITAPNHLTIPTSSFPHHRPHISLPASAFPHHCSHIIVPHYRHHINVTTLLYPPPYYHIPVFILWPHSTAFPFSSSLPILQRSPFPAIFCRSVCYIPSVMFIYAKYTMHIIIYRNISRSHLIAIYAYLVPISLYSSLTCFSLVVVDLAELILSKLGAAVGIGLYSKFAFRSFSIPVLSP